MKPDEKEFLLLLYRNRNVTPRLIINDKNKTDINHKRAWYILEKNTQKLFYDYGVSLDTGWLTPEGIEFIENHLM